MVLEKILKAHYAKDNDKIAPKTHDLLKLAKATSLKINDSDLDYLDYANEFNIEARYPEEKFKFYQTCTKEFAIENIHKTKELYKWLKSRI